MAGITTLCGLTLLMVGFGVATDESGGYGIARMMSLPSSLNVREGVTVELPCDAVHIEGKVRVWKKQPSRILFSGSISVSRDPRIRIRSGGEVLIIEDIIPEYSGIYSCKISHHHSLNVTYNLRVLVPPTIVPDPANGKEIVRKGNPATLLCDVSGIPKPTVTWSYEGEQSSSLPSGVRQVHGTQLQVASADVHHTGIYKCTAENDVGDPVTATFNMTVLYAPEVMVQPDWIHGDEGVTVEFVCTCNSMPISQIQWVRGTDPKHGTLLQPNQSVKISEKSTPPTITESHLRMQRMRREDLGSYTCVGRNSVGVTFRTVEVSGLAEPVQLRGVETGESSFQLTWTAKSYSPVMEYQLKIRKHKSGHQWTDVVIPVSEDGGQALFFSQSYNVTGLEPGTQYEAVLQAHNDHGWNRPSDTFLFSAGTPLETETSEETTELTLLPFYDADLDVTDPTYLKQASARSISSHLLILLLIIICLI